MIGEELVNHTIRNRMETHLVYCLFGAMILLIEGVVKNMLRISLCSMYHEGVAAEVVEHVSKDGGLRT